MERRDNHLESARIATSLAAGVSGAATAFGVGYAAGRLQRRNCLRASPSDERLSDFGCSFGGGLTGVTVGSVLWPITVSLGTQLTHHSLGGRAGWWVGTVGAVAGSALGFAGTATVAANGAPDGALFATLTAAAMVSAAVPVLALEWSHRRNVRSAERESARQTARIRIAPQTSLLKDGIWLGLAGTL